MHWVAGLCGIRLGASVEEETGGEGVFSVTPCLSHTMADCSRGSRRFDAVLFDFAGTLFDDGAVLMPTGVRAQTAQRAASSWIPSTRRG